MSEVKKICLYCARFLNEEIMTAPLGVAYLAAYLLDQRTIPSDNLLVTDSFEEVLNFKPDIVGISSLSHVLNDAVFFAENCKKDLNCLTVIGGYHISCVPNELPDIFDIGVIGEGEKTFNEIVIKHQKYQPVEEWASEIKGIVYKSNNTIKINDNRDLISDISLLPWPYRHRLYSDAIPVFTSRGCPYRCTFCASHKFWSDTIRFRSADSVIKEIIYLVDEYEPKEIAILDDLWMADKKRFQAIVEGLVKNNIPQKVTFRGFCRSNLIQEEDIILLKALNYRVVRFGAETGSDRLLKKLKGNNISIDDHQRVIDLCQKHGLRCGASFMFGVPGETLDDLSQTIAFLNRNKNKFNIIGFYYFNPIPGTILWDELQDKKLIDENFKLQNMQLDMLKPDFSWENIYYFNQNNVDLIEFRSIVSKIKNGFLKSKENNSSFTAKLSSSWQKLRKKMYQSRKF